MCIHSGTCRQVQHRPVRNDEYGNPRLDHCPHYNLFNPLVQRKYTASSVLHFSTDSTEPRSTCSDCSALHSPFVKSMSTSFVDLTIDDTPPRTIIDLTVDSPPPAVVATKHADTPMGTSTKHASSFLARLARSTFGTHTERSKASSNAAVQKAKDSSTMSTNRIDDYYATVAKHNNGFSDTVNKQASVTTSEQADGPADMIAKHTGVSDNKTAKRSYSDEFHGWFMTDTTVKHTEDHVAMATKHTGVLDNTTTKRRHSDDFSGLDMTDTTYVRTKRPKKECAVCCEDKAVTRFPLSPHAGAGEHSRTACMKCWKLHITTAMAAGDVNEVKCLQCEQALETHEIQKLLSKLQFNK